MALTGEQVLTTLATVKDELAITDGGSDALLERYIRSVSSAIVKFCNRNFERKDGQIDNLRGNGRPRIYALRPPVLTLTSVAVDGILLASNDYSLEDNLHSIFRDSGWPASGWLRPGITQEMLPGTEERILKITYDGGWVTPQQVIDTLFTPRTLPHDLEDLAVQEVTRRFRAKGRDGAIASESFMGASQSYRVAIGESGLPDFIEKQLMGYWFPRDH